MLRWTMLLATICVGLLFYFQTQPEKPTGLAAEMNALLETDPNPPLTEEEITQWENELNAFEAGLVKPIGHEECRERSVECLKKRTVSHRWTCIGMGGCDNGEIYSMVNRYILRKEE